MLSDMDESLLIRRIMTTPYVHGGRGFEGADCYGAIILWYRHLLGVELWDIEAGYPADWKKSNNLFIENYYRQWLKVDRPAKHDIVLFRISPERLHAGIYMSSGKFLHLCQAGGIISRVDEPAWKSRIEGFYRFKKLNENNN